MSWSRGSVQTSGSNNMGVTLAAGRTVIVVAGCWDASSTHPSSMTYNGITMTSVIKLMDGFNNAGAGLWYLNNPPTGSSYNVTMNGQNPTFLGMYPITGTIGETAAVRGTCSNSSTSNDWISSGTASSATGDLGFYCGDKDGPTDGGGGIDDGFYRVNDGGIAYEAGNGAGIASTYGNSGDDAGIALCGMSLMVKPLTGGNVLLYL